MKKVSKQQDNGFSTNVIKLRFQMYYELGVLFYKNFFRTFAGPFFTFALPLFFLMIFYYVMGKNSGSWDDIHGHDIIGGYILLSTVSCGFNFLTGRICEWKSSVFLKRLNVTPLKKIEFMFVIVFFYSIICIIGCIWMVMWSMIVNPKYQIQNWIDFSNWGYIILGIILNIFIAISLAIFIGGISVNSSMGEGLVMIIFFPSIFLTGIVLPINVISNGSNIINYVAMILPFKYSVSIFIYGWWYKLSPTNPLYNVYYAWNSTGFTALWQPLLGAILYPALLLSISTKTFKWETK